MMITDKSTEKLSVQNVSKGTAQPVNAAAQLCGIQTVMAMITQHFAVRVTKITTHAVTIVIL